LVAFAAKENLAARAGGISPENFSAGEKARFLPPVCAVFLSSRAASID